VPQHLSDANRARCAIHDRGGRGERLESGRAAMRRGTQKNRWKVPPISFRLRLISVNGRQTIQSANRRKGTIDAHGASMVLHRSNNRLLTWLSRAVRPFALVMALRERKLRLCPPLAEENLLWTGCEVSAQVTSPEADVGDRRTTRVPSVFARNDACRTHASVEMVRPPAPPRLPTWPRISGVVERDDQTRHAPAHASPILHRTKPPRISRAVRPSLRGWRRGLGW